MIALKRLLLVLAAALVVVQPALACCCLEDLAAQALEPVAEIPSCHQAPESGSSDTQGSSPYECLDCADYETVLGSGVVKAFGPKDQPGFKLPPVDTEYTCNINSSADRADYRAAPICSAARANTRRS